ncbi:MAG: sulfite exporter TauE/SafE family protein [Thiotrichales bacterium]
MEYLLYFVATFALSTLFAMAGTGAGIALIPLLHLMGVPFNLSKAVGLFVGFTTTVTSTVMNFKRSVLDVRFALPLAAGMLLCAPLGAQLTRFVDERIVKIIFVLFLLTSATLMLFFKRQAKAHVEQPWVLALLGAVVGALAGLLGVGGGNLLLPLLILLGYAPKKVAVAVSFVVPFAAIGSFVSYATFIEMDYLLLLTCTAGAIAGGFLGNYLMHFKLTPAQIKKVVAIILYILAIRMTITLF